MPSASSGMSDRRVRSAVTETDSWKSFPAHSHDGLRVRRDTVTADRMTVSAGTDGLQIQAKAAVLPSETRRPRIRATRDSKRADLEAVAAVAESTIRQDDSSRL